MIRPEIIWFHIMPDGSNLEFYKSEKTLDRPIDPKQLPLTEFRLKIQKGVKKHGANTVKLEEELNEYYKEASLKVEITKIGNYRKATLSSRR